MPISERCLSAYDVEESCFLRYCERMQSHRAEESDALHELHCRHRDSSLDLEFKGHPDLSTFSADSVAAAEKSLRQRIDAEYERICTIRAETRTCDTMQSALETSQQRSAEQQSALQQLAAESASQEHLLEASRARVQHLDGEAVAALAASEQRADSMQQLSRELATLLEENARLEQQNRQLAEEQAQDAERMRRLQRDVQRLQDRAETKGSWFSWWDRR